MQKSRRKNWSEDAGSGQLSDGVAVIQLEPVFAQTVNTGVGYHVFLTPNGDCKGLYVTNKTADSFEVRELGGGKANVSFDYRIMARRKGYEDIRLADKTKQFEDALKEPQPRSGVTPIKPPQPPRLKAEPASAQTLIGTVNAGTAPVPYTTTLLASLPAWLRVTHPNLRRFPLLMVGAAIGRSRHEHSEKAIGECRGPDSDSAAQGITAAI